MSRKYSIGFLVGILIVIGLFILGFKISYNHAVDRYDTPLPETETIEGYYVKNKDGYLTVYQTNGEIYEYTTILSSQLPEHIQEGLNTGIHLENLSEVYGFLENYSS